MEIRFQVHGKSLASAAVALLFFSLPFIGVPKPLAWTLFIVAVLLAVFAVFVWRHERKPKAEPQAVPEPPRETEPVRTTKGRAIRASSELAKAAAGFEPPSPARVSLAKAAAGHPEPQLPSRLPTISPEAAGQHLAEIEALRAEAEPLIERAWSGELRMKRTLGFVVFGKEFVEAVDAWNKRVHAVADETMSVKERAQVRVFQTPMTRSLSGFGVGADRVEEVIRDNLRTLDVVEKRCRRAITRE